MRRSPFPLMLAVAFVLHAPSAAAAQDRLLLFTKTLGYRHDSIPNAIEAIRAVAARHGVAVEHSEDGAVFSGDKLAAFRAVAFVNSTGEILDAAQQRAFEAFVAGGGGFLGVHAAADTAYGWPWYGQLLGSRFKSHPPGLQTGTVRFAQPPAGVPAVWSVTDEFYNFTHRPDPPVTIVAALDESSYAGGEMGADHPIAWCREIHGGRSWYTGLGHRPELFADPTYLAHLETGLLYAIGRSRQC